VRVELDAVARREEHGLARAGRGDGPLLGLELGARRDGELLPDLERRRAVREPDDAEAPRLAPGEWQGGGELLRGLGLHPGILMAPVPLRDAPLRGRIGAEDTR